MLIEIFIEPHERQDALESYRDRLTQEQIEEIKDAPDDMRIKLVIETDRKRVHVVMLEP